MRKLLSRKGERVAEYRARPANNLRRLPNPGLGDSHDGHTGSESLLATIGATLILSALGLRVGAGRRASSNAMIVHRGQGR